MNPEPLSTPTSDLPIEIWGQVFRNIVNPLDLLNFRRVCRKWNQEINRVLPFADWKKLCSTTIGVFPLSSIMTVVQPMISKVNYGEIENQDFWRDIYYHYKKWLRIKELPVRLFKLTNDLLLFLDEFITSFDIWDDWITYGTSYGKILIFNKFNYRKPRRILESYDKIQEVKLWYDDNQELLLLVLTRSHLIKIWNLTRPKSPPFILPGHKLCIGTANNVYILFDNLIMRIQSTPENITVKSICRLDLISGELSIAINSRESKIFVVTQISLKLRVFTIEDESLTTSESTFKVHSVLATPSLPVIPANLRVFVTVNRTIICLQNEFICLHIPTTKFWVTQDKPMYFNGNVTSLIVHGNYLIIGLSNGILLMYYVEGITNLMRPGLLSRQPEKMYSLDILPIIGIKVADISGIIHVVAFNRKDIFVLTF